MEKVIEEVINTIIQTENFLYERNNTRVTIEIDPSYDMPISVMSNNGNMSRSNTLDEAIIDSLEDVKARLEKKIAQYFSKTVQLKKLEADINSSIEMVTGHPSEPNDK